MFEESENIAYPKSRILFVPKRDSYLYIFVINSISHTSKLELKNMPNVNSASI